MHHMLTNKEGHVENTIVLWGLCLIKNFEPGRLKGALISIHSSISWTATPVKLWQENERCQGNNACALAIVVSSNIITYTCNICFTVSKILSQIVRKAAELRLLSLNVLESTPCKAVWNVQKIWLKYYPYTWLTLCIFCRGKSFKVNYKLLIFTITFTLDFNTDYWIEQQTNCTFSVSQNSTFLPTFHLILFNSTTHPRLPYWQLSCL